jgi:SAM-dependent methyltransferase
MKNAAGTNSEYDPFASVYNRFWGLDYHAQALPAVKQLLLTGLPANASILDVCCGSGQFTGTICSAGFRVTGVDASVKMIEFARRNAPGAKFTVADVRDFSLGRKFGGAYSVFESLNHIRDKEGLGQALRCVRRHLRRGAIFLFDLNGEKAFQRYWNDGDAIVEDDIACILRSEYDEQQHVGTCYITVFEKTRGWTRRDFQIQQTCHDLGAVQKALEAAKFSEITFYSARDLGMDETTGFDRTFIAARAG